MHKSVLLVSILSYKYGAILKIASQATCKPYLDKTRRPFTDIFCPLADGQIHYFTSDWKISHQENSTTFGDIYRRYYMQEPRIETLQEKKLIGKHLTMSFADNKTAELWRSFMPHRKEIQHVLNTDLYSLQLYKSAFFESFNPHAHFEKWAAVEVSNWESIPDEMEFFILEGGLYAVFTHKGSSNDTSTFQYIFSIWLPHSAYVLDDRPHFELLGEKYKNADPASEEEIWIPIKPK